MVLVLMDYCEPDEVLEAGLICCNYTICDKYCYQDTCLSPKTVWFCTEGIFNVFFLKFVPSIIFTIIGVFLRCLNFNFTDLLRSGRRYSSHFSFLLLRVFIDCLINLIFCFIIGVNSCYFEIGVIIEFNILCLLFGFIPLYFLIFKYFSPFCQCDYVIVTRFSVNFFAPAKLFNFLNNALFNIWMVIFTLTGYYGVFDVFAYMLNKNYRDEIDSLNGPHP